MNLKELKEKYDGKGIAEIEKIGRDQKQGHEFKLKEMIGLLFYLESTKRFRENPQYQKSNFPQYLDGVFGMSFQTYFRYCMAMMRFGRQSDEVGMGMVNKIIHKVGAEAVPMVVKELKRLHKRD